MANIIPIRFFTLMQTKLHLEIRPQPDDTTCGPTCLHAVYKYYDDQIRLREVIDEVQTLETGGTLAPSLGSHALGRGYSAVLYTFDMQVFDPTWFALSSQDLIDKLQRQLEYKNSARLQVVTAAYVNFLQQGGKILFVDLTMDLIRGFLRRGRPLLTGLSATYLYRTAREIDRNNRLEYDDLEGEPSGHFVVLSGYDVEHRTALVADPLNPNPMSDGQYYEVKLARLIAAIMLGNLTSDANLLLVSPKKPEKKGRNRVNSRCH